MSYSMEKSSLKLVYVTPALYMAGGVERVLTLKANYFAEHYAYDITIILTEGKNKPLFYPLSEKIKVVNLDINFEELWNCSFAKKIIVYLKKQHLFKKRLSTELKWISPDITISLLRREINFINEIKDGSKKIGELHINRANYRNFNTEKVGLHKRLFAKVWSYSLLSHLKRLDHLVVLTEKDRESWVELNNVTVIPDPLSLYPQSVASLTKKRVVAIARYSHEKGIDLLLKSWKEVENNFVDWQLDVYGDGERTPYERLMDELGIDRTRCHLHGRTNDVESEYCRSSISVLSSRFEGFGMVITEAMSCGLPVVAFDCPWGPRSIIKDGVDGLLAANGDVSDLARKMEMLMGDRQMLVSMSRSAVLNVQRYNIQHIAEIWKRLFEQIMAGDNK